MGTHCVEERAGDNGHSFVAWMIVVADVFRVLEYGAEIDEHTMGRILAAYFLLDPVDRCIGANDIPRDEYLRIAAFLEFRHERSQAIFEADGVERCVRNVLAKLQHDDIRFPRDLLLQAVGARIGGVGSFKNIGDIDDVCITRRIGAIFVFVCSADRVQSKRGAGASLDGTRQEVNIVFFLGACGQAPELGVAAGNAVAEKEDLVGLHVA